MSTNFLTLECDSPLNERAVYQVGLFRERFKILWANWESLKREGIELGGSFRQERVGQRLFGTPSIVESFRLKGYYVDFRFFFAPKEPTNYHKVSGLIGKHCSDKRMRKCLKENNRA